MNRLQYRLVRLGVFVAILAVLNVCFAAGGVHEHISISGSIIVTLIVSGVMMLLLSRRSTGH